MENLATKQNETVVEFVQMFNCVLASICGLAIHCYILYRIKRNHSSLNHYQNFIVVQSIVGVVFGVVQLITNQALFAFQRLTFSGKELVGFSFAPYGLVTERVLLFFNAVLYSLEQFLIMIFNIHRTLMLLRYNWIKKFYIVFMPFMLAYTTALGVAKSLSMTRVEVMMRLMFVPSIIIISILCYILLRRHFRTHSGYSTKVKQMQARFSKSIVSEGVIHGVLVLSVLFLVPLNLLISLITNSDWTKATVVSLFYMMIVLMLLRWYFVAVGALTLWSIYGFLKRKGTQRADASVVIHIRQINRTPSL